MSNLSELLPTGGGQNSVDFVATGTLASGQAVALKTDGTVEVISGSAAGFGSSVVFESGNSSYISSTYDSTNNKIVIAYGSNFGDGTAIVGTVSGTSISFGTAVVFNGANSDYNSATYDSTNEKIVIFYKDNGNSGHGTAIVGTVSGTSISFGTAVVFESAATEYISATFDSNSNKVVIAYRDSPNSDSGTAIVGTVSGTAISFGTAVVYNSGTTDFVSCTFDSDSNKVVIAYRDVGAGSPFPATAIVGTVSGTAISFGTPAVFESAESDFISATFDSTNGKIVIAYRDVGNSSYGTSIVGTVSGTSISFGTAVVFESAYTLYISAVYDPTNNKVVINYRDNGGSDYGTSILGTVSGTSISFGTAAVFESAVSNWISATYDSTNEKVVIGYADAGNGSYGTAIVYQVGVVTNSADFIGITAEAISSAATGAVNVYGGINAVQTGLTIASDYYVQSDGTLSTASASPAIKVGQAVSATTINMKDLT